MSRIEDFADRVHECLLHFDTWAPGDGVTRYRLWSSQELNARGKQYHYFSAPNPLTTQLGIRDAEIWLDGYSRFHHGESGNHE